MDPPPHPLSNAAHVLRYHPLRCIIIIILAAVFVADDMFEVLLLANGCSSSIIEWSPKDIQLRCAFEWYG